MLLKVNTGDRVDLEFMKGLPVSNYAFEILNDDCTEHDFTHSDLVVFKLYAKRNGKLLAVIPMMLDSPATNKIYLNSVSEITGLRATEYYHVVSDTVGGKESAIFDGVSRVV